MELQTLQSSAYGQELLSHMYDLYQRGQLCDLALQTSDRVFSVHKVVLTAASQYFKTLFDSGNMQGPSCVLQTLDSNSVDRLIEFMYTSYLTLSTDTVWIILAAASMLEMPQAIDLCQKYLKAHSMYQKKDEVTKEETNDDNNIIVLDNVKVEQDDSGTKNLIISDERTAEVKCDDSVTVESMAQSDDENYDPLEDNNMENLSLVGLKLKINLKHVKSDKSKPVSEQQFRNTHHQFTNMKQICEKKKEKCTPQGKIDIKLISSSPKRGRGRPRKDKNITATVLPISTDKVAKKSSGYKNHNINQSRKRHLINLRCEKKSHVCNLCGNSFFFRSCLVLHNRMLHMMKLGTRRCNFRCSVSSNSFTHTAINKHYLYACPWAGCQNTFKKSYQLKAHLHLKHYKNNCRYCKLKISKACKHFVAKHLEKWDRKRRLYRCGECHRIFMYKMNLKTHFINTHLNTRRKAKPGHKTRTRRVVWKCEEKNCGYVATGRKNLVFHMSSSHPHTTFQCKDCSFETPLQKDLERHFTQQHCTLQDRRCDLCKKTLSNPFKLRMHKFMVHKIEEPGINIFRCDFMDCEYSCVNINMLRKHQTKHNEDRKYTCDECGKQLKTPITLEKHIKKVHKGIKPYMCEICGVSYGEESELKIHINRHGDTKSFFCSHCDYSAYDKGNFKSHLFNRHGVKMTENMKTFSCNICDYVTDVKYRYNDHMRVHLNMRDIQCPECEKCFMTRKALRGHVIKVHKPKNLHCDFCGYATADVSKLKEHVRIMHTHRNFKPYKCGYCSFTCATGGNCRKHVMQKHRGYNVKVLKMVDKMPDVDLQAAKQLPAQTDQQKPSESVYDYTPTLDENLLQDVLQPRGQAIYSYNGSEKEVNRIQFYKEDSPFVEGGTIIEQGVDLTRQLNLPNHDLKYAIQQTTPTKPQDKRLYTQPNINGQTQQTTTVAFPSKHFIIDNGQYNSLTTQMEPYQSLLMGGASGFPSDSHT